MTDQTMMRMTVTDSVRDNWAWFLALGIVFILGGVFAIVSPLIASIVVTTFVGAAFTVSGALQVVQAWRMRSWAGFLWQLIVGAVVLAGGIAILVNPIVGSLTLTLFLAAMFIAKGVFQIVLGFRLRPHDGWLWIAAAGVIAVLVGLMIWVQWPFSGLFVPGILAGISLTFTGWSYIMIALAARRLIAA